MIRQCHVCNRGFVDVWRPKGEVPPFTCAVCRRGGKPLSRLVGGVCPHCGKTHKGGCSKGLHRMF